MEASTTGEGGGPAVCAASVRCDWRSCLAESKLEDFLMKHDAGKRDQPEQSTSSESITHFPVPPLASTKSGS